MSAAPSVPVHALAGLRVLELGTRTGCRVCGSLLATLGADVFVLEEADSRAPAALGDASGDDGAGSAPPGHAAALHRAVEMAGKLSVVVDRHDADARQRLLAAARRCDICITSSDAPSAAVGAFDLATGAIVVDITAVAEDGDPTLAGASDLELQALSGMVDTTGLADGPPVAIDGEPLEFIAGVHALAGALAALRARRRDGGGERVQIALLDCALSSQAVFVSKLLCEPDARISRVGNRHALASPWNVFRAADGWLLVCMASEAQWQRCCELMGCEALARDPRFRDATVRAEHLQEVEAHVQQWVGTMDIETVSAALLASGIPCGPVATIDGYPREANLDHRRLVTELALPGSRRRVFVPGSPFGASATPGRAPARIPAPGADTERFLGDVAAPEGRAGAAAPSGPRAAPLAGVRVVELGQYTTAPLAARYLANLGAEVIKVETPGGEAMRGWQPQVHGQGSFYLLNNTGKRNVVLDLKSESGLANLVSLVARADVVVENLKPGALARMGLPYARMSELNPGLVYCAISGFGADSAYPGRPAYDTVIQAMSGLMDRVRSRDVPLKAGMSAADIYGANLGVALIVAALEHRERTGRGQFVDVSMQDVTAWSLRLCWNDAPRLDARIGAVACTDGFVLVENADESADVLAAAPASDRRTLAARFPGRVHPVLGVREFMQRPQVRALVLDVPDAQGRVWPVLRNPIRLSRSVLVHGPGTRELDADGPAIRSELRLHAGPTPDYS